MEISLIQDKKEATNECMNQIRLKQEAVAGITKRSFSSISPI